MDVFTQDGSIALLGAGWYPCEQDGSGPMRWVSDDIQINVAQLTYAAYTLLVELEPGPAVGNRPFDLVVMENGKQLQATKVVSRDVVKIDLGRATPTVRQLVLTTRNASPAVIVPGDARVLKFRVLKVALQAQDADIVSVAAGFGIGKGWFPLEKFGGETFRWAGSEAIVEMQPQADAKTVAMDLEPGPGVGSGPLKIKVLAGDKVAGEVVVKSRQRVNIPWPAVPNTTAVRLLVDGGGKTISTDNRVMNFRAFVIGD